MTDRNDAPEPPEYREQELRDKVSGLGDTPEDALEEVASRNDSLEERLPDQEPGVGGRSDERAGDGEPDADVTRGEGAPGQG
ncbi:hypothetical protein ACRAWC_01875 [Leifsonia sp. L25]|uniref:hypothetical protein n=1 Tax=Actinomycetes TaxID=1760 RepID=UPI003D69F2BA